jgi:hypothetical protein
MAELPTRRDFEDYGAWAGRDVVGPDGERLGAVDVIFLDEATQTPEWVLVTLDGGDAAFVALAGASVEERSIRVEHDRERIAAAPSPEPAETLSVADERRLYEHYGLAYSQDASSSVLPEGASAEERPRLRKYVGAPVPAPAAEEPAAAEPAAAEPAPEPAPAPTGRVTPSPTVIPGPAPHVVPPEGGFQSIDEESRRGLSAGTVIPVALAAAIAGLIGVLAYRRRR